MTGNTTLKIRFVGGYVICTFFGHRDAPDEIQPQLERIIINLIEKNNVNKFYVGNNGKFDYIVKKTLIALKERYDHIDYFIVLAYLPIEKDGFDYTDYSHTVYFDEISTVPKKIAIYKRNELMIKKSHFVVTYVNHNFGCASVFKDLAEKQNKYVINIQ